MKRDDIGTHCSAAIRAVRVGRLPGARAWSVVTLSLLALSLWGCGTSFVYNRLDWISRYYVSSQVDLDDAQSRALEANVDDFFAWHRRSELPRYALFLERAANDAVRPVSLAQLEAGQREVDGFMSESVAHVAPAAARWLNGLRPAQVDELFAHLAEKDRKARADACAVPAAERRGKSARRFADDVEEWTGDLDRAQRDLIESRYAALGRDECADLAERERSHAEFHALVDRFRARPEFAARIAAFLADRRSDAADRERFLRLLTDINHSLTPGQRERTVRRLRLYAREMRGLAAESDRT